MSSKIDELNSLLACAKTEHELLEKNLSSSNEQLGHAKSLLDVLHVDHDDAREQIALLHSVVSLSCNSCESLHADLKQLKLAHSTCVV